MFICSFKKELVKILSLKNAPKVTLGCIVSIYGTQAILRNQIDTISKSELSFFEYAKTPMVRAFSV